MSQDRDTSVRRTKQRVPSWNSTRLLINLHVAIVLSVSSYGNNNGDRVRCCRLAARTVSLTICWRDVRNCTDLINQYFPTSLISTFPYPFSLIGKLKRDCGKKLGRLQGRKPLQFPKKKKLGRLGFQKFCLKFESWCKIYRSPDFVKPSSKLIFSCFSWRKL